MVCELMACYMKAPSVEAVGKFSSGPWRVVGEIAKDKADYPIIIMQGSIR
jgi:hypothetical protein